MNDEGNKGIPKPQWDDEVGASYVGKYILVGVTYLDQDGNETQKQQLHGVIESASEADGIKIQLKGVYEGESWVMPADQRAISKAPPGKYTLHMSGEKVEDPDLVSTWTVREPGPKH